MTWQPIATAPQDGSQILGWYKGWSTPLIVHYYTGLDRWSTTMQPTHWLPWEMLPAPPKEERREPKQ